MARINSGSEKIALIADGIGGEENIKVFLNKLFENYPIIVDVADTKYETYDIKLKNTTNNKIINVELETATKSEEWNAIGTLTMVLSPLRNTRSGLRPHWPFGLNIPARKIFLHNDATLVEPKILKTPQPFNIYLRVSKNLKHFFAVEWKDMLDFLNEEDSYTFMPKAVCQLIPNVYDEVSNTNVFVSIDPQTVLDERFKRLVYDDPIRLRDKIINLLN